MTGKTVVITGASTGIGKIAARELARAGASVTLVCQDPRRGERALAEVQQAAGHDRVRLALADFASPGDVRRLAAELSEAHPAIDVLINNAGVFNWSPVMTPDGFEGTIAVNHLAPFLLTHLLLRRLEAAPAARIVNTASGAHHDGDIDFQSFRSTAAYQGYTAYSQSKLANVLFTYALAERLADRGMTANCLHPGFVPATNLVRRFGLANLVLNAIGRLPGFKTPDDGARTIVHLAASPEVAGATGQYYVDGRPGRSSRRSHDAALRDRLWEVSAELTGIAG